MLFRPDRKRSGPDPTLLQRMALFAAAAVLALAGMLWSRNVLVNTAIGILVAALLLGMWGRKSRDDETRHDDGDAR